MLDIWLYRHFTLQVLLQYIFCIWRHFTPLSSLTLSPLLISLPPSLMLSPIHISYWQLLIDSLLCHQSSWFRLVFHGRFYICYRIVIGSIIFYLVSNMPEVLVNKLSQVLICSICILELQEFQYLGFPTIVFIFLISCLQGYGSL